MTEPRLGRVLAAIGFLLVVGFTSGVVGQDCQSDCAAADVDMTISPYDVYVTTQDFVSLRIGPGTAFTRSQIVPAVQTLPAVGRTPNGRWIQVVYSGQRGWIAARYLVWSGNLSALPVSTMEEQTRVVRTGAMGYIPAGTPLYDRNLLPAATATVAQEVELIGRLGSGRYIWLQVDYQGVPYWVHSWEIDYDSEYVQTLDIAYLIPYTRLARGLDADISRTGSRLAVIEDIWTRLASGGSVSCGNIPALVQRATREVDLRQEPVFAPVIEALDAAILDVNTAISAFDSACQRPETAFFLTQEEVIAVLTRLTDARRRLVLADALAAALFQRDPIVISSRGG